MKRWIEKYVGLPKSSVEKEEELVILEDDPVGKLLESKKQADFEAGDNAQEEVKAIKKGEVNIMLSETGERLVPTDHDPLMTLISRRKNTSAASEVSKVIPEENEPSPRPAVSEDEAQNITETPISDTEDVASPNPVDSEIHSGEDTVESAEEASAVKAQEAKTQEVKSQEVKSVELPVEKYTEPEAAEESASFEDAELAVPDDEISGEGVPIPGKTEPAGIFGEEKSTPAQPESLETSVSDEDTDGLLDIFYEEDTVDKGVLTIDLDTIDADQLLDEARQVIGEIRRRFHRLN